MEGADKRNGQLWSLCPFLPAKTWKRECMSAALPGGGGRPAPQPAIRTARHHAEVKNKMELGRGLGRGCRRERSELVLTGARCVSPCPQPAAGGCPHSLDALLKLQKLCLECPQVQRSFPPLNVGLTTISWVSGKNQNPYVARGQAAPPLLPRAQLAPPGTCRFTSRMYPCPGAAAAASSPQQAKERFRRGHPPKITVTSV